MIHVTEADVEQHVDIALIIDAVEASFASLDAGQARVYPAVVRPRGDDGGFFGIKSGEDGRLNTFGFKAGAYFPANLSKGLSAHSSTTFLFDAETCLPVAFVEANYLNGLRTAAADAVAVKHMARPDARILSVFGGGPQAMCEIRAVLAVRPIRKVLICTRDPDKARRFAQDVQALLEIETAPASSREAAQEADILVTVTASRRPVFDADWVRPGVHISAMGADNVGKHELPLALFDRATLFVDDPEQSARIGEGQHLVTAGRASVASLAQATLGGIITGRLANPRITPETITVFDSSGLATQDLAAAHAALTRVQADRAARPSPVTLLKGL